MKEVKTFWKVNQGQTCDAGEREIMYIDGEALLYREEDDDTWYNCADTDAEFFPTREDAQAVVEKNRKEQRQMLIDSVEFIDRCHSSSELCNGLEGEELEDFEKKYKRYQTMYRSSASDVRDYRVAEEVADAISFVTNAKPMYGRTESFFFKDILYAERGQDKTNGNREFYYIHLKGGDDKILVYQKNSVELLGYIYGDSPRVIVGDGVLNFLNR